MTTPDSLAAALAAFQATTPQIAKNKQVNAGPMRYKYADLPDVIDATAARMASFGLSFTSAPTYVPLGQEQAFVLRYKLLHSPSGEYEEGMYPLPDPLRAKPQELGSAITYARRYCLTAVLNVAADEDVDGQGDGPAGSVRQRQQQRPAGPEVARCEGFEKDAHPAPGGVRDGLCRDCWQAQEKQKQAHAAAVAQERQTERLAEQHDQAVGVPRPNSPVRDTPAPAKKAAPRKAPQDVPLPDPVPAEGWPPVKESGRG